MRLQTKFAARTAVLLFAVAVAPRVWAAAAGGFGIDANQPIAVNADSFVADLNGDTGLYTGNVVISQGAVKLHADRVKVMAPAGKASRMEADGHVIVDSPCGQAVGDTGVYDVAGQTLHLNGHVVLTKDANVMRGDAVEFSMSTGIARLTAGKGNGVAADRAPGRVQGLFLPQGTTQTAQAAAPAGAGSSCGNTARP